MPGLPEIRAVLFDLDDTLVDRKSGYNSFYRSFYDRHDEINESVSWPDAKRFFWTLSPNHAADLRQAFAAIKSRWPSTPGDPETHYHSYFQSLVDSMQPLPGVLEMADALNDTGMPWGVVTNGGEYQLKKVVSAGLEGKIPFVIATELHGASKPDPEPYLHALRLLEMKQNDTNSILFVGDNPHTDIIGAHAVGMKTAWIHMGRSYPEDAPAPDLTVASVRELDEVLGL